MKLPLMLLVQSDTNKLLQLSDTINFQDFLKQVHGMVVVQLKWHWQLLTM